MFGWLKSEPRCPVAPELQAWLEGRVAWIAQEFGIERLHDDLVLPNDDFFPDKYRGTEDDARRLFEQVCEYMEIDPSRVDLRFYKAGDRRTLAHLDDCPDEAGFFQDRNGRVLVQVEESQFSDPHELVAVFARELAHVHLHGDNRLQKDAADGELVTDLLAVFLGFGVFMANAASGSSAILGLIEGLGYLSDCECAYALSILAWLHCKGQPPWASLVRPNVREPMQEAVRWLAEIDENTQLPRGHRFDNLGRQAETIPLSPHFDFARSAAESAAETDKPDDLDHFGKGVFALTAGHFAEALQELSIAITENPEDAEAYQQRAMAYMGLNRVEEALADAHRAVAMAPEDVEFHFVRGKALMLNGLYDLALADFDVVIDDNDDHGSASNRLAEAYYQRGLVRAIQKDMAFSESLLSRRDSMAAAIRDFSRAIGTVPCRAEVYEARAAAYEFLGKTREAQQDREEAEWRRAKRPS
jgi:tetratricopeptide (TPR) repeat protein